MGWFVNASKPWVYEAGHGWEAGTVWGSAEESWVFEKGQKANSADERPLRHDSGARAS